MTSERCKSCYYSSCDHRGYRYVKNVTCDYILVTGERRGCPTGDDCTKYRAGKRKMKWYVSEPAYTEDKNG